MNQAQLTSVDGLISSALPAGGRPCSLAMLPLPAATPRSGLSSYPGRTDPFSPRSRRAREGIQGGVAACGHVAAATGAAHAHDFGVLPG